jgi:hypothetical protein
LRKEYQHRQDIIDALVDKCKDLNLLVQQSEETISLIHDTLAPVVSVNTATQIGQASARPAF